MRLTALLAFLILFLWGAETSAQTTFASITGTVTDSGGAAVAGADVEAVHVRSNYRYTVKSNEVGAYTLPNLREGEYRLRVQFPGFQEFVVQNIELVARDQRRIDVELRVGSVETRVEVTAGATLIETETARIGDAKSNATLNALPLNTRSLYSFLALTPGVLAATGQATRRFAGSRINQSDQSIDGITVSNGFDGTQISPLVDYIESFAEVRVDLANNTADIGSIGQVTVISKSGSNEFHGSAFTYYSTPAFRARDPFAAQRPAGILHQPGFSAGGPVWIPKIYNGRNRTFFFGSFETRRGSNILQLLNPTVPLPSWRAGDFSAITTPVRDPFGSGPFPGNRIPASRLNPVSVKYQDRFWPLPNFGDPNVFTAQNYREQRSRAFDTNTYWTTRLDHRFSEKSFVFGRYTWNRTYNRPFESNLPTVGQLWQVRDTRAINLSYTHTFTSNLVSESRWGYAWNNNPRNGPIVGSELVRELGLTGLVDNIPNINGLLDVSFAGLGITRVTQTQWRHPGFLNFAQQIQQHLNWYRGKHAVKGGFQFSRVNFQDQQANDALFGRLSFSNRFTGHPYADFLLGAPTNLNRGFPPVLQDRTRWAYEFFITDDWKVTQTLTLNIGLRYEVKPGYSEAQGMQALFDIGSGSIVVPDGALRQVSPLVPAGYVPIVEASSLGYHPRTLIRTDWNNWAPRLGLAWRPFGPNTVFRAGYGIFYDVVPRALAAGGSPFVLNEPTFTNPVGVPQVVLPRVFPSQGGALTTIGLPAAVRQDIRLPLSMQYNVTLEHQRWSTGFRLSYIGTNTRQGEWGFNINSPLPDATPFVDKARMFPRYPAITYFGNGAGHQYHSLQAEAERRFSSGLAYQLSWTWARDIGDLDRGQSPENPFDRRRERGVWIDIPTHRVTGNVIYELPFGKGKPFLSNPNRFAQLVAGGWELSGVYNYHSGQFLTPQWTGPDPVGIAFTTSRTPPNVTLRPDILRDPNLPAGQRTPERWFDISAFAPPQPGAFGTSSRGTIFGPNSIVWSFALMKTFPIGERARIRADILAANALNRPNYSLPNTNIADLGTVGVISGVGDTASLDGGGPRALRAGLRFEW
jgi:hypothetical protein